MHAGNILTIDRNIYYIYSLLYKGWIYIIYSRRFEWGK